MSIVHELRSAKSFRRSLRELHERAAEEIERLTGMLKTRETTMLGLLDLKIVTEQEVEAIGPLCEAMAAARHPRKRSP